METVACRVKKININQTHFKKKMKNITSLIIFFEKIYLLIINNYTNRAPGGEAKNASSLKILFLILALQNILY